MCPVVSVMLLEDLTQTLYQCTDELALWGQKRTGWEQLLVTAWLFGVLDQDMVTT